MLCILKDRALRVQHLLIELDGGQGSRHHRHCQGCGEDVWPASVQQEALNSCTAGHKTPMHAHCLAQGAYMNVHLLFNSKHLSSSPAPACTSTQVGIQKSGHGAYSVPDGFLRFWAGHCAWATLLSVSAAMARQHACRPLGLSCLRSRPSTLVTSQATELQVTCRHTQMSHERHPGPTKRNASAAIAPVLPGPRNHLQICNSALLMQTTARYACQNVNITRKFVCNPVRQCLLTAGSGWMQLQQGSHHPCWRGCQWWPAFYGPAGSLPVAPLSAACHCADRLSACPATYSVCIKEVIIDHSRTDWMEHS